MDKGVGFIHSDIVRDNDCLSKLEVLELVGLQDCSRFCGIHVSAQCPIDLKQLWCARKRGPRGGEGAVV